MPSSLHLLELVQQLLAPEKYRQANIANPFPPAQLVRADERCLDKLGPPDGQPTETNVRYGSGLKSGPGANCQYLYFC